MAEFTKCAIMSILILLTLCQCLCIFPTSHNSDMSDDLESLILSLPHLAEEATRLMHSENVNILEVMQRRLEDTTRVINTLVERWCLGETNC